MVDPLVNPAVRRTGFRRLSWILTVLGLVALAVSLEDVVSCGVTAWNMLSVVCAALLTITNALLARTAKPAHWMELLQAGVVLVIGTIAAVMSAVATWGGMIVVGVGLAMFARLRAFRRPYQLFLAMVAVIAADSAVAWFVQDARIVVVIGIAAISFGSFGIIYYAFYTELNEALTSIQELRTATTVRDRVIGRLEHDLARSKASQEYAAQQASELSRKVKRLAGQIDQLNNRYTPVDLSLFDITPRETEVLRELVQVRGRNRDIASTLGITERTVKAHVHNVCNKVGVDTRLELAELFRYNWPEKETGDQDTRV
jgi:LuxR family transcriptional regulator of spore coat protein